MKKSRKHIRNYSNDTGYDSSRIVTGKFGGKFAKMYSKTFSKIGWFAVWTETIEKDGTVVTDRIPYILIVDNRVTVVSNTRVVAKL